MISFRILMIKVLLKVHNTGIVTALISDINKYISLYLCTLIVSFDSPYHLNSIVLIFNYVQAL